MEKQELQAYVRKVVADALDAERRSMAALVRSVKVTYTKVASEYCMVDGPPDAEAMFQELAELLDSEDRTFTVSLVKPGAAPLVVQEKGKSREHVKQMMLSQFGETHTVWVS